MEKRCCETDYGLEKPFIYDSYIRSDFRRNDNDKNIQCPHSEEEDSVATICGFGDNFRDLRVQTH